MRRQIPHWTNLKIANQFIQQLLGGASAFDEADKMLVQNHLRVELRIVCIGNHAMNCCRIGHVEKFVVFRSTTRPKALSNQ